MAQPDEIRAYLENLSAPDEKKRIDALRGLFWTELNYEQGGQTIPTSTWTDRQREGLLDLSVFAYYESQFGRFDIIYGQLEDLKRGTEREIITKLLDSYPYALFVFSDRARENWHFVNVKYAKDASARRLFRRITVGPREQLRTASQRIAMLDIAALQPEMFGFAPLKIQTSHDQAFDVEAVTRAFYHDYDAVFKAAEAQIRGIASNEERRLFTQRLFNRLMFIRFLERKGWLAFGGSQNYLQALWRDYTKTKRPGDTFYISRLVPLFFAGLNNSGEIDLMGINGGGVLKDIIGDVPYLNGGLFEEMEPDRKDGLVVPDSILEPVVDGEDGLFYRFNFTVTESTPFDIEVAVDPEMLGKIFEELVTGRHESGSYYTPKAIVSFMGREAIRNYLQVQCPKETAVALSAFIDQQDAAKLANPEGVLNALKHITICDPACGSGAYLLGMMQELLELRRNLFAARHLDAIGTFSRKLEIIQGNLYGVDIDPFAVNITRLRLWLSLIVDFEGEKPLPLPNLDYKVEIGNSLTAPDPSGGLQPNLWRDAEIKIYLDLKNGYLNAHGGEKKTLHSQIEAQRQKITQMMQEDKRFKNLGGFDWMTEFTEVFNHGGFDVIVANPPYVRQELIKDQKPALKAIYGDKFAGTADLFVYFYFRALQLLRPDGVMAFISSNKWMRAGYGEKLRETLRTQTTVKSLIDFGDLPLFGAIAYPCVIVARRAAPQADHQMKALTVDDLGVIDQLVYEVDAHGWQQPQTSLAESGWSLMRPSLLALLDKLKKSGSLLTEYVDDKIYVGIKTGFNAAFVINRLTRDQLIKLDAKNADLIKRWTRGRDVKRWQLNLDSDSYLIYVPWGLQIQLYPHVENHLRQYHAELSARPEVREGRLPWYALSRYASGYSADFEKTKIIWPDIAKRNEFTLDESHSYPDMTLFTIPKSDLYLLGILNSRVTEWVLANITSSIQNGFLRLKRLYLEQLTIPKTSSELRREIEKVVATLLKSKNEMPAVTALESQLNALVYQAYRLTAEEIALIDESPQPIGQIQIEHPDQWLAIEVTERDNETNEPVKGYLRAVGETQAEVFKAVEPFKGKSLYVFFNEAQGEIIGDEA